MVWRERHVAKTISLETDFALTKNKTFKIGKVFELHGDRARKVIEYCQEQPSHKGEIISNR